MTEIVNNSDAETNPSKLVPIVADTPTLGTMRGRWPELDDESFAPLTGADLDAWHA